MSGTALHLPKATPRAVPRGVPHLVVDSGRSKRPSVSGAIAACRSALLGTAGISLVTNLLMLTGPLFMLQIYDRVLASGSVETLAALLVLVTGLFTFMGLLELVRARVLVRVGLRIDRLVGKALFESVLSVAPAVGGARQTQALRDLEQIRQFAGGPVPSAAFDAPWVPIYFAVLFLFHSLLGLVALAGALVLVVLSVINEALSRRPLQEVSKLSTRSMEFAEAGRRNAETLHAMGMTAAYCKKWLAEHQQILSKHLHASDVAGTLTVSTRIIRLFLQSLVLAAGAYLALQQAITPGLMIAASIIMSRALSPIEQLIGQWRSILAVRQAALRVEKQLQQLPEMPQRITLPRMHGHLTVSDVYAAPLGSPEIVLKGLNFSLAPGQAVGVIGPSASGKSTLARALVGVWPLKRGEIRLDGAALDQWDRNQLGQNIGYLPQDIELFDGTIAENIARFDSHCGEQQILSAANRANVHELILRLPQGYETRVGEAGAVLSGGQRQRIALARALCGDPAFIVLDEPNSNLDSEGEQALCNVIRELRRDGRTIVIMAHRASVISTVSHLLVLRDGRQFGFGSRDDVLRKYVVTDSARSDHDKN
jgi:ATP-binding cassette, subfamily C, type I secretion system permease/ATPase